MNARLEAVPVPPRPQERLLHRVVGLLERGEHPVAVHVQLTAVSFEQFAEVHALENTCRSAGGGSDLMVN
ncbi:hypothetical protein GCM10010199_66540 [Dactylosporangium roseum]